eukprot:UN21660
MNMCPKFELRFLPHIMDLVGYTEECGVFSYSFQENLQFFGKFLNYM